jgi:hypothetical protein
MALFADHLRSTLGTNLINAALTGYMRLFVPTLGTNTVAARTRARLGAATAPASPSACPTSEDASSANLALANTTSLTSPAACIGTAIVALLPKSVTKELLKHNLSLSFPEAVTFCNRSASI